jgi:CRISPR-associated protein Cmr6
VTRRKRLQDVQAQSDTHAGLWLERFIVDARARQGERGARAGHVADVTKLGMPSVHAVCLEAWRAHLERIGAQIRRGAATSRLCVGLGASGTLETSISLHRTFGVPFLPGSALKGLAAGFAHREFAGFERGGALHAEVFGNLSQRGSVVFHDAHPESFQLHAEIMTPHHANYYTGTEPPADWDSPTPVPYLSATGTFLIALSGETNAVRIAHDILRVALLEDGIGAKTSSGYGRVRVEDPDADRRARELLETRRAAQRATDLLRRFRVIKPAEYAGRMAPLADELRREPDSDERRAAAREILERFRSEKLERSFREKPWWDALRALAGEA